MTEPETYVMPARVWGDEPDAPKAEPVVEVSSRDGAEVPEVAAVTRLRKTAEAAEWQAWTTYARADVPGGRKPAHIKHTVCLRLRRNGESGYALWYREDRKVGADGIEVGTWKFGDAMIAGRPFAARALAARLSKDVPGALSTAPSTPDGGKGGGVVITGSSSPANPGAQDVPGALPPAANPATQDGTGDPVTQPVTVATTAGVVGPPALPPPPPAPGTWGSLLAGDEVIGADGRRYEVLEIEPAGAWVGSGLHDVRVVLQLGGDVEHEPITLHRTVTDAVHIAARGEIAQAAAVAWDAGLRIEPAKEITVDQPDQFSAPAPAPVQMTRMEPPTGQYGWYKLPDPAGVANPGIYPRVSTIIKTMANDGGLTDWKIAQAIRGLAKRPDLIAMAASLDPDRDKAKMREVIEQADAAAGSKSGANLGTAIDRFTERLDAGESVASMGVPDNLRAVVEAYGATLARYGLTVLPEYTQRTVLNTTLAYAGTWDRLVRDSRGRVRVLDVKTNKLDAKTGLLPDYHWFEWGQQFALYARAEYLCSLDFAGYDPMPHIDQSIALVLHLPINGKPDVYEVDILKSWAVAQGSIRARQWRTESRSGWSWKLDEPTAPVQPSTLVAVTTAQLGQIAHDPVRAALDLAVDANALIEVARLAREAGVWTAEHDAYALVRYDLLRVATAPDTATLAALWDELHPAGRWTDDLQMTAATRWDALQQLAATAA